VSPEGSNSPAGFVEIGDLNHSRQFDGKLLMGRNHIPAENIDLLGLFLMPQPQHSNDL
jgi:hypothetical protein